MDGMEVEVGGVVYDLGEVEVDIKWLGCNVMGDFICYFNVYSFVIICGVYEGQCVVGQSGKCVLMFMCLVWVGQQCYVVLFWLGDMMVLWVVLCQQIVGGLNVGMVGLFYWLQDMGGFFVNYVGGECNLVWCEFYVCWNQFGIFNLVYCIYGISVECEFYLFKMLDL